MRLPGGVTNSRRAVSLPLLWGAAREHRCVCRFAHNDFRIRPLLVEDACDAFEGAARAVSGHPIVKPLSGESFDNFSCGRARVQIRVSLFLELMRNKPTVGSGELNRFVDHSDSPLSRWSENHLGPQEAHQLS